MLGVISTMSDAIAASLRPLQFGSFDVDVVHEEAQVHAARPVVVGSKTATKAPRLANRVEIAKPSADSPPVTTATRPMKSYI